MRDEIELNGRQYSVIYTTDELIPENKQYIDHVEATVMTPQGRVGVMSPRILNRLCEKLEGMIDHVFIRY